MPDAAGRFRGISLAGLEIPWQAPDAAAACVCADPCDLCIESDGKCARGDDCACRDGETAEPGQW